MYLVLASGRKSVTGSVIVGDATSSAASTAAATSPLQPSPY